MSTDVRDLVNQIYAVKYAQWQVYNALEEWKRQQQIVSIAVSEVQQEHISKLTNIELELKNIGNTIYELMQVAANPIKDALCHQMLVDMLPDFFRACVVIAEHPPAYVVSHERTASKKSKYWFNAAVYFLASDMVQKLTGISKQWPPAMECVLMKANGNHMPEIETGFFVADSEKRAAIIRRANGNKKTNGNGNGANNNLDNHELEMRATITSLPTSQGMQLRYLFENLSIEVAEKTKREEVKYSTNWLQFRLQFGNYPIVLDSLPMMIYRNHNDSKEQTALLKRAFNDNEYVDYMGATMFFEYFLQSKIRMFSNELSLPHLSDREKSYLVHRLVPNYQYNVGIPLRTITEPFNDHEGECSFNMLEWLNAVAKLLACCPQIYDLYQKRLIYGFCSKTDIETHLSCEHSRPDAFGIKFSDRDLGAVRIGSRAFRDDVDFFTFDEEKLKNLGDENENWLEICKEAIRTRNEQFQNRRWLGYMGRTYRVIKWCRDKQNQLMVELSKRGTSSGGGKKREQGLQCNYAVRNAECNAKGAVKFVTFQGHQFMVDYLHFLPFQGAHIDGVHWKL